MRDLEWSDLRIFLGMLRASSVGDAARLLGVDASTVRRRVAALEASLGAKLFARTNDGLRPTALAERLRAQAERVESDVLALRGAVDSAGSERAHGVVRVATTEGLATFLIERGLLNVVDTEPGITIEILAGNRPVDIARGEADLAVRLSPLKQASLRARCVVRFGVGLYASPAYHHARGGLVRSLRMRDALAGHDILLQTGELAAMPEAKWLASREGVRVVLRSNSMTALAAAAAAGRGIVALGLGWGDRDPGLLRIATLDLPARPIWLVTTESERERSAVRVVAARIAALFAAAG